MRDPGNRMRLLFGMHIYIQEDSESSNRLYFWNLQPLGLLLFGLGGHATLRRFLLLGSKNNIT